MRTKGDRDTIRGNSEGGVWNEFSQINSIDRIHLPEGLVDFAFFYQSKGIQIFDLNKVRVSLATMAFALASAKVSSAFVLFADET